MLSCCFVRALHEIRRRMLPSVQATMDAYKHRGIYVHSLNFFPQVKQKLTLTKQPRFYGKNSINPRIKELHTIMVDRFEMPPLSEGQMARHYRHVALTLMYLVGCPSEAKARHSKGSKEFERSYEIDEAHPDFAMRLNALEDSGHFAQLYAAERLLL